MRKKVLYIEAKGLNNLIGIKSTVIVKSNIIKEAIKDIKLDEIKEICVGIINNNNRLLKRAVLSEVEEIDLIDDYTLKISLEGKAVVKFDDTSIKKMFDEVEVTIEWSEYKPFNIKASDMEILKNSAYNLFNNSIVSMEQLSKFNNEEFIKSLVCMADLSTNEINLILSTNDYNKLYNIALEHINNEILKRDLDKEIDSKVKAIVDKDQRNYYLKKKLEILQNEVNDNNVENNDDYNKKIEEVNLPIKLKEKLKKEVVKLTKMPDFSSESSVIRNYLDTVLELPWNIYDKTDMDIIKAKKILDEDHYALSEPKDNIIDYLSYLQKYKLKSNKKNNEYRPTIICLVGPPGVGKTSFAASIAKSINRKFARIALGGVSDEAEIRGHRRTYVGAMAGRIINTIKRVKTSNPVILLDEIDKLSYQYKGDPSSALLEVLDPEQNKTFEDRFIDYPFDLSSVLFICTANDASRIPAPLYDRMEIIYLDSYTDIEKVQISKKYIIPALEKITGIVIKGFTNDLLLHIIHSYTKEAGVRTLKRLIEKIYKKVIRIRIEKKDLENTNFKLTKKYIKQFLGAEKYKQDKLKNLNKKIGNVTGLAWTSVGGTALEVQAVKLKGKGKLILTGKLGDVMKESAQVAHSYIRLIADKHNIDYDFYEKNDIHLHFPEGAVPKDGPSAGITITTAMLSVLTNKPVRQDVAMTGEITIRGDVLPIGGVKEKLIGAINVGATEVILPYDNMSDVEEIPKEIKKQLKIHFVKKYDEIEKILF